MRRTNLEGIPHGFGRAEFRSGAYYEGTLEYGLMHGKGKIWSKTVYIIKESIIPKRYSPLWI